MRGPSSNVSLGIPSVISNKVRCIEATLSVSELDEAAARTELQANLSRVKHDAAKPAMQLSPISETIPAEAHVRETKLSKNLERTSGDEDVIKRGSPRATYLRLDFGIGHMSQWSCSLDQLGRLPGDGPRSPPSRRNAATAPFGRRCLHPVCQ